MPRPVHTVAISTPDGSLPSHRATGIIQKEIEEWVQSSEGMQAFENAARESAVAIRFLMDQLQVTPETLRKRMTL